MSSENELSKPVAVEEQIAADIIRQIEHGDYEHREWLKAHSTPIIVNAIRSYGSACRREALTEAATLASDYGDDVSSDAIRELLSTGGAK